MRTRPGVTRQGGAGAIGSGLLLVLSVLSVSAIRGSGGLVATRRALTVAARRPEA